MIDTNFLKYPICGKCQQKLGLTAIKVDGKFPSHGICPRHQIEDLVFVYTDVGLPKDQALEKAKLKVNQSVSGLHAQGKLVTIDLEDPRNSELLKQFMNTGFLIKHTGKPLPTSGEFPMKQVAEQYSTLNLPKQSNVQVDEPKDEKLGDWVICSGCVEQFKIDQTKFSTRPSYGYCPRHLYERFIKWAKMQPIVAQQATIKVLKTARAEGKQIPVDMGSHPDVVKKFQTG